jgi:hypothetical protein
MGGNKLMHLFILPFALVVAFFSCKDAGTQLTKDEAIPEAQTLKAQFAANEQIGYVITNERTPSLTLHNCCPGVIVCYLDRHDNNEWRQHTSYGDPCVSACYTPRPIVEKEQPYFGTIEPQESGTYRLRFVYTEVDSMGQHFLTTNSFVVR